MLKSNIPMTSIIIYKEILNITGLWHYRIFPFSQGEIIFITFIPIKYDKLILISTIVTSITLPSISTDTQFGVGDW
jgi:hypothetical protein